MVQYRNPSQEVVRGGKSTDFFYIQSLVLRDLCYHCLTEPPIQNRAPILVFDPKPVILCPLNGVATFVVPHVIAASKPF